jgi:hypothetical protein
MPLTRALRALRRRRRLSAQSCSYCARARAASSAARGEVARLRDAPAATPRRARAPSRSARGCAARPRRGAPRLRPPPSAPRTIPPPPRAFRPRLMAAPPAWDPLCAALARAPLRSTETPHTAGMENTTPGRRRGARRPPRAPRPLLRSLRGWLAFALRRFAGRAGMHAARRCQCAATCRCRPRLARSAARPRARREARTRRRARLVTRCRSAARAAARNAPPLTRRG